MDLIWIWFPQMFLVNWYENALCGCEETWLVNTGFFVWWCMEWSTFQPWYITDLSLMRTIRTSPTFEGIDRIMALYWIDFQAIGCMLSVHTVICSCFGRDVSCVGRRCDLWLLSCALIHWCLWLLWQYDHIQMFFI